MQIRKAVVRAVHIVNPLLSSPSGPLEGVAMAQSFEPSLMPRSSVHQGIMMAAAGVVAHATASIVERLTRYALPSSGRLSGKLGVRAAVGAVGAAAAFLPERPDETLWRSGVRSAGRLTVAASASGAAYDVGETVASGRDGESILRPAIASAAVTAGLVALAGKNLKERKQVIKRWPVEQKNELPVSLGIGWAAFAGSVAVGKAFSLSRNGIIRYLGPGRTKRILGSAVNAGVWAAGASALYNAGVGYVGRANERVEPAYAMPPVSPLVSGSAGSTSPFEHLGLQGRRFVTDVVSPEMIEEVLGEPARKSPIRVFIGYNSEPMYSLGRTEMAMAELERTGAFDRSNLLLVSPTGTGWVDQTMIESAEFLTRGDIATCVIQYGRFPSFLSLQKVALGRHQFRALLWGIRQRLAERPAGKRPKVFVFGESLGAWASSDVLMYQGIEGFDHYGIDKALWVGLPGLAKWSRNGMASGSSEQVPGWAVNVFDNPDEIEALSDEQRERLRVSILSHDNDPIAAVSTELMIRKPAWLEGERGRGVPGDMDFKPIITFLQVGVDAMNAMVTVPGHFGSFGHDYRADMARMVRGAYGITDVSDEQIAAIEDQLVTLELERASRIKAAKAEDAPAAPQYRGTHLVDEKTGTIITEAGVPLSAGRTEGARWMRVVRRHTGAAPERVQ